MATDRTRTQMALQVTHGALLASVQFDLTEAMLAQFQAELLEKIRTSGARNLLLDLSAVDVIDIEAFDALRRIATTASVMGTRPIFVGFQPGVVSSLVDLGVDTSGMETALNLEDAYSRVRDED